MLTGINRPFGLSTVHANDELARPRLIDMGIEHS
jgi:type II secretory ATPase GspE/PulE/Tfp pilus assembly ATPase PilB-like protein